MYLEVLELTTTTTITTTTSTTTTSTTSTTTTTTPTTTTTSTTTPTTTTTTTTTPSTTTTPVPPTTTEEYFFKPVTKKPKKKKNKKDKKKNKKDKKKDKKKKNKKDKNKDDGMNNYDASIFDNNMEVETRSPYSHYDFPYGTGGRYYFDLIAYILRFGTLFACQKGIDKQCRPRSDCFWRRSPIRVCTACYSDKYFVNPNLENQGCISEQNEKKHENIRWFTIFSFLPSL